MKLGLQTDRSQSLRLRGRINLDCPVSFVQMLSEKEAVLAVVGVRCKQSTTMFRGNEVSFFAAKVIGSKA